MSIIKKKIALTIALALAALALNCTPAVTRQEPLEKTPSRKVRMQDVDFARAFAEDSTEEKRGFIITPLVSATSTRYPPHNITMRNIRVMLKRNVREANVTAPDVAHIRSAGKRETFSGRLHIELAPSANAVVVTIDRKKSEFRLPCTLFVSGSDKDKLLNFDGKTYRGALVLVREGNAFSVINYIGVENYLRGVVPKEIGYLREEDIEAVKAQAVAARTYAYKRMLANENNIFDVVATVSDQVYDGASAEGEVSDRAILQTKDLIMAYGNEIVQAFYHSTCGGKTANINEVWSGDTIPYLRSIDDVDKDGNVFCATSNSFTWTETWTERQLTDIIKQFATSGNLQPAQFKGSLRKIEVRDRFDCGRVKTLAITSSDRTEHTASGDKLRFVLRRNTQSRGVLRSANISEIRFASGQVTISGRGYGHGIGMCQVGAISRARAGQTFEEILRAYYRDVQIKTATN